MEFAMQSLSRATLVAPASVAERERDDCYLVDDDDDEAGATHAQIEAFEQRMAASSGAGKASGCVGAGQASERADAGRAAKVPPPTHLLDLLDAPPSSRSS